MIRALIFDFDGLILETEEPTYQSWAEVYQSFGYSLPFSTWSRRMSAPPRVILTHSWSWKGW